MVKKFLPEAIMGIEALGQTIEGQTRKAVQMHSLALNFALQLKEKICKEKLKEFGPTFEYKLFTWVKLMVVDVLPLKNI